jgi:hypothetical protein
MLFDVHPQRSDAVPVGLKSVYLLLVGPLAQLTFPLRDNSGCSESRH